MSWNRYTYSNGDPINNWDPTGLSADCAVDICVTVTAKADPLTTIVLGFLQTSQQWNQGTVSVPPPPAITPKTAYRLAQGIKQQVAAGKETDCQALADFASNLAELGPTKDAFVKAFGVLTPKSITSQLAGVAWNEAVLNGKGWALRIAIVAATLATAALAAEIAQGRGA